MEEWYYLKTHLQWNTVISWVTETCTCNLATLCHLMGHRDLYLQPHHTMSSHGSQRPVPATSPHYVISWVTETCTCNLVTLCHLMGHRDLYLQPRHTMSSHGSQRPVPATSPHYVSSVEFLCKTT